MVLIVAPSVVRAASFLVPLHGRDERGLRALIARQQDPASPDYHRWLTPEEFGRRFGATPRDLRRVSRWLANEGCRVKRFKGRRLLRCTGPAKLESSPEIAAIAARPMGLDDPIPTTQHLETRSVLDGMIGLSPAEFTRVYDLESIREAGVDGAGQTIGIVTFSQIDAADVAAFRAAFDLAPVVLSQSPGSRSGGSTELEALLDVSWSGALAPGARIFVAVGAQLIDSLAMLVNQADVAVISSSLDLCPRGARDRRLVRHGHRLLRQAQAEGQTVLFASGDTGTRSCKRGGLGAFTASPLITAVGGTTPFPVFDADGNAVAYGSEVVWNDVVSASGGGVTSMHRPSYQRGRRRRTVPDVSFPAALVYPLATDKQGVFCCVGGTSAAAPSWAGMVALMNQMHGQRAGFLNPRLYELGRAQMRGGGEVFHDITEGSNAVIRRHGFSAGPGYDLATGWGSVDGDAFLRSY